MKILCWTLLFCAGVAVRCHAQTCGDLNDCKTLERILNSPEVKKFLYSGREFLGLRNASGYFTGCKSVYIDGKAYSVSNYTEAGALKYVPVDIVIPDKDLNSFILEWVLTEEAAIFDVVCDNGVYHVSLSRVEKTN